MDDYLLGFRIPPILNMERLEEIVLFETNFERGVLVRDVDEDPLAVVKRLGITIESEFRKLNRDVVVGAFWWDATMKVYVPYFEEDVW
jgi:hypothetical protein